MVSKQRDSEKEVCWREVVRRQAASGVSIRAFCQQEQLAESAFYAWRRTIAERDGQAPPTKMRKPSSAPTFVPAMVTDVVAQEASIVLELAGGRVLRLPASISIERLAGLVQALEARGPR